MTSGDCPPGYIRTALGNCIKDPTGQPEWELDEEAPPQQGKVEPFGVE
ncbi:hypothetical protein [uncultured Microbacterium sp.]|uniref:Uncharacterized protein n=1 Tax=uncultured Microbacterium sp. TaxID=191216 RepID=A0A1Y5NTV5_9MICO|nr:hypothetical protein [uncultured Microbacterium sp.]SBS69833.1 hypothetical protein MIPYR_10014 [uncultured Microbacterium sp.]